MAGEGTLCPHCKPILELLDHLKGAQEVASGIAQEYLEHETMADAVRSAAEMVAMACELEGYGERENDD